MKKKRIFIAIIGLILTAVTFNLNVSRSNRNGDISLFQVTVMANAAGENYCTQDLIGYFCYEYLSGDSYCTSGTAGSCQD